MEEDVVFVEWIGVALMLGAGLRLVQLGVRFRSRPECLLAAALLLRGASSALSLTPGASQDEALWLAMIFGSRVGFGVGVLMLALFTREKFRIGEPWSNAIVAGAPLMVAAGLLLSALAGDWVGWSPLTNFWVWLEWVGLTVPLVWLTTEATSRHGQLRRRARSGAAAAGPCRYYRLLAAFGWFQLVSQVAVLPLYIQYETQNRVSLLMDAMVGGFEGLSALTAWLAYSRAALRGPSALAEPGEESGASAPAQP